MRLRFWPAAAVCEQGFVLRSPLSGKAGCPFDGPLLAGQRLRQPLLRLSLPRRIELRLDGGLNLRKIGFTLVSSED